MVRSEDMRTPTRFGSRPDASGSASMRQGQASGSVRTPAGGRGSEGRFPRHHRGELATPSSQGHRRGTGRPRVGEELTIDDNTYIFGTRTKLRVVADRFCDFARNFKDETSDSDVPKYMELLKQVAKYGSVHFPVDMEDVHDYDTFLYHHIVSHPREVVPVLDDLLYELAISDLDIGDPQRVELRPYNSHEAKVIRDLNPGDLQKLVAVTGMVTRVSMVIPELKIADFQCEKCNHQIKEYCEQGKVSPPDKCPNCNKKFTFKLRHNTSIFGNKQVIKMQENPNAIPEGETPHTVTLYAYDNMVDMCRPGDRVAITGIYIAVPTRVNATNRTVHSVYKTYIDVLHAHHIERSSLFSVAAEPEADGAAMEIDQAMVSCMTQSTQLAKEAEMQALGKDPHIYEKLVASLAPSIWEMEDVKKGILCQLFGGSQKAAKGFQTRADVHVLLVGDPGVSKSQLLTYVHKIAPRGLYTSGKGTSAVGLTAFVSKDPESREMVLESGALVLSDEGICCIDEFDKMSDDARTMLHEVMEQQTVSVAKAGIVATLNARTSVLASANPVDSRYNPSLSVMDNIRLPPTLVSRFDLIYLLLDIPDDHRDRRLARHLVSMFKDRPSQLAGGIIPQQTLREYIAYARKTCQPEIGEDAAKVLVERYKEMRQMGAGWNAITATPRQLESFIRIAEALAKMQLKNKVEAWHAEEAVRLVRSALAQSFTDRTTGRLDLDTLYTGLSTGDRKLRAQLGEDLKHMLADGPQTIMKLHEVVNERGGLNVTLQAVKDALTMINNEVSIESGGVVRLRGMEYGR